MPDFYAHLQFCRAVQKQVSPGLQSLLREEWDSFLCGGLGPDPLYFYMNGQHPMKIRQAGLDIHHGSGAAALERFRQPILDEEPYAVSFAAGYLLHFLLDARCHPYVKRIAADGICTHFALEAEFDRYLLRRHEVGYLEALPAKILPPEFYTLAAKMADGVTPEVYRAALRKFRWTSIKLGLWAGKPVRHVVNAASRIPGAKPLRGMILDTDSDAKLRRYLMGLDQLCDNSVEPAVEELGRFFGAVELGMPFSEALGRDFSGKEAN